MTASVVYELGEACDLDHERCVERLADLLLQPGRGSRTAAKGIFPEDQ